MAGRWILKSLIQSPEKKGKEEEEGEEKRCKKKVNLIGIQSVFRQG